MNNTKYTVDDLIITLKNLLKDTDILYNINVIGEVTGFKPFKNTKTYYFNISSNKNNINAVIYKYNNNDIKDGDKISVKGNIKLTNKMTFLLEITTYELIQEIGYMKEQILLIKSELIKNGYFDIPKKQQPPLIKKLGIATSLTGSVIQDILSILNNKFFGTIYVKDCHVQGLKAESSISNAISYLDNLSLDAIIVCRGGGSYEDLYVFSKRDVIMKICKTKTYIISAIGHETDHTLSDDVADIRAATPSVAAEIIIKNQQKFCNVDKYINFTQYTRSKLYNLILDSKHKLSSINNNLISPINYINNALDKYVNFATLLNNRISSLITQKQHKIQTLNNNIISPLDTYNSLLIKYNNFLNNLKYTIITKISEFNQLYSNIICIPLTLYNGKKKVLTKKNLINIIKRNKNKDKKLKLVFSDGSVLININDIEEN